MKKQIALLVFFILTLSVYSQEKRLALIIGNGAYEYGGQLRNPENDADAMSAALRNLGFEVMNKKNLTQAQMKQTIDEFGANLKSYDVGLFFYAGHGIQSEGFNYLIPVDVNLKSEQQVEYDCVRSNRVLSHMEASGTSINIVILDACRNNPFERSWNRTASSSGLAFMDAPTGTLIAYATAPGSVASDGHKQNSVYTEAILESIVIPNIDILKMFQNVRTLVSERSNDSQIPWESTSLTGDFCFNVVIQTQAIEFILPNNSPAVPFSDELKSPELKGSFIDRRDGQEYKWVRIGKDYVMAENLNFETAIGSWSKSDIHRGTYGLMYDYETALEVCPEGWYLPLSVDWFNMFFNTSLYGKPLNAKKKQKMDQYHDSVLYINGKSKFGGKLKMEGTNLWRTPNYGATNELGFNALPAGSYNPIMKYYMDESGEAVFWAEYNQIEGEIDYFGNSVVLSSNSDSFWFTIRPKNWRASVRCFKKIEY